MTASSLKSILAVAGISTLANCSLPEPDGTEARLIEQAAVMTPLTASDTRSAEANVRNGLLLDPDLQSAASEVSASADEVRVQRAAQFPSLSLSIGGGAGDAGRDTASIDLNARQLITDFGATDREVTLADVDLQLAYLRFQSAVNETAFEVLTAFDNVRRLVRLKAVREEQLARMTQLLGLVARQTEIGAAPASDVLEARKTLQSARFFVHDTDLALAEARARLAQMTGQSRGGRIGHLGSSECKVSASAHDLRLAELELARAELDVEKAEKARAPRIFLEPIARQSLEGDGISTGVNVGLQSDLFAGGALSARLNAARNKRDGAGSRVQAAQRDITFDVASNRREIAGSQRGIEMVKTQLALLERTRSLYRSQYFELGTREVADLLSNEEEFFDLKAELIEFESTFDINRVQCALRDGALLLKSGLNNTSLYGLPISDRDSLR